MPDTAMRSSKYPYAIVIRVDDDLRDAMAERAVAEDRTMASLIRAALRSYVKR